MPVSPKIDPFKTSYSTVEEMLTNPSTRLRQNPSKAYETIVKAVKDSGGWIQKRDDRYNYGVLSGPYTGTYILGARYNSYVAAFDTGVDPAPNTLGLYKFHFDRIWQKIAPVYAAVKQAESMTGAGVPQPALEKLTSEDVRARLEKEKGDEHWREYADQEEARMYERAAKRYETFTKDPEKATALYAEAATLSTLARSKAYIRAQKLYIMSQAANVPVAEVINALQAKPKRLYSVDQVRIPTRLSDRSRYSAEFLRTWSAEKAFNRLLPNVEGSVSITGRTPMEPRVSDVRGLLNKVPSWRQMAEPADVPEAGKEKAVLTAEEKAVRKAEKEKAVEAWIEKYLMLMHSFEREEVARKVFREQLLRRYDERQLRILLDAIRGVRQGAGVLALTAEGRLLNVGLAEQDWPRLIRGHDLAVAAGDEARGVGTAEQMVIAQKFKSGAAQFEFPEGVRPLLTKSDYKTEGTEMRHCVYSGGYFLSNAGYEFAFKAPDGTRATLQLSRLGKVDQFYSQGNGKASPATKQLLDDFLSLNARKIAAMADKSFPVYPKDNPSRGGSAPGRESRRGGR